MKYPLKTRFYLAHPLDSRQKIREWELGLEKRLDIELINPFYDIDRIEIKEIDNNTRKNKYELSEEECELLVLRDIDLIKNSQGIIALVDGSISYGTIMEIAYAKMMAKYIYMIVTNGHEKHPWFKYHANKIFTDFKSLEEELIHELYYKRQR